ncbi:MAG: hypothetical protein WAZ14_00630 [Patescibacteria group bacterium]
MLTRILLGAGIIVVGYLMALKTNWFLTMLGPVAWAERTFVSGGSRTFYKLLGMVIIIIGIIVVTNLFDRFIGGFVTSIF